MTQGNRSDKMISDAIHGKKFDLQKILFPLISASN